MGGGTGNDKFDSGLGHYLPSEQSSCETISAGHCNFFFLMFQVEEKIRKELQEVTGNNRNLSLLDKPNTPYLLAAINEVQRLASILNTNIFRQATDDVKIGNYLIKKGTPVVSQLSVIMSEENVFEKKFDVRNYG